MTDTVIVALLSMLGTLAGAYFANRRTTALIAYRLEQLEEKVNRHNRVVERTYKLEEQEHLLEERIRAVSRRIDGLEQTRMQRGA